MTIAGWISMIVGVGGATAFLLWCVYRIVSHPGSADHLHSQVDIEPKDRED